MKQFDSEDVVNNLNKLGKDPAEAYELFGQRGYKGWNIALKGGVKKYVFKPSGTIRWIVVGDEKDYTIFKLAGYCSCNDFYFTVMKGKALVCQHLIAQRFAEKLNLFETIEANDETFNVLIEEWMNVAKTK